MITAFIVWHPRTPRERHELVYEGADEGFAHAGVRRLIEGGEGSFGYVRRSGITVSYISESAQLRPVA